MKGRMKDRIKVKLTVCAACLSLLLGGCSVNHGIETSENMQEKPTQSESALEEKPAQNESALQETTEQQATAILQAPTFLIEESSREAWHENGEDKLVNGVYAGLKITGDGYEGLKKSLESWNGELYAGYEKTYEEFQEWAREHNEIVEGIFQGYAVETSMECTRADSRVLSVLLYCYEYAGGAHGNYGYQAVSFDAETGAQMQLSDVLADRDGFMQWAKEEGWRQLEEEYGEGLFPDAKEVYMAAFDGEPVWYLDGAGINVLFNPYELGPYAMGTAAVTFSYEDCAAFLKPEYGMPTKTGSAELPWDTEVKLAMGEGQALHTLRLWIDSDETRMGQVCLDLDGTAHLLEIGERGGSAYLVRKEHGRVFLIYDADPASDDFITYVYELTDGAPVLKDTEYMAIVPGCVSAQRLQTAVRVDFLGTYTSIQEYELTEEGELIRISEGYPITDKYGYGILTVKQPIPVVCDGEEQILPAGTRLRITETDLKGTAGYRLVETGEEGEIHFQYVDETRIQVKIGEWNETECFEDLPYAG